MNQKSLSKIIKAIVDTIDTSLKPGINDISEKVGDNSYQMREIRTQLNRIEYKLDLLLSSQALNRNLLIHKRKVIKS